jgi:hypothetical protein
MRRELEPLRGGVIHGARGGVTHAPRLKPVPKRARESLFWRQRIRAGRPSYHARDLHLAPPPLSWSP